MGTTATPNARLWVWTATGELARITLRPGQRLTHIVGGPTDEGWRVNGVTWSHDGARVSVISWHDGCDCDGRLAGGWTGETDGLPASTLDTVPEFREIGDWRRDYAAEAAGY